VNTPPPAGQCGVGAAIAGKDAEIARLRTQVAELQQEKQILRKAAAYFTKEVDR
jgi:transposase